MSSDGFDLAVIGGGVIGLAHAYWAARAGRRVAVIEKDARANGASIRNFGFITVTGQGRGRTWRLAARTRDVWAEVAPQAGVRIEQRGHYLTARSPEATAVIEKDSRANGASIRNFGFITVTGQERGDSWSLARRTRDVWAEVAPKAGVRIEQQGLYLTARSAEAVAVIGAFQIGRAHV